MKENVFNLSYFLLMKHLYLQSWFNSKRNTCLIASLLSSYIEERERKTCCSFGIVCSYLGKWQKYIRLEKTEGEIHSNDLCGNCKRHAHSSNTLHVCPTYIMLHFSHLTKYLNISQFILRKVNERIQMYMLKKKTNICQRNILLLKNMPYFLQMAKTY
jgi:hypothetical protein